MAFSIGGHFLLNEAPISAVGARNSYENRTRRVSGRSSCSWWCSNICTSLGFVSCCARSNGSSISIVSSRLHSSRSRRPSTGKASGTSHRHRRTFQLSSAPQGTVFDLPYVPKPPHSNREDPKAGNARIFILSPKDPSVMTTRLPLMLLMESVVRVVSCVRVFRLSPQTRRC